MVASAMPIAPEKDDKESADPVDSEANHPEPTTSPVSKDVVGDPDPVYPPGFFTDKKGNLKFVNVVVRYPCLVFLVTLALCIVFTIALGQTVFKAGNPITDDSSTYDIYDVRSSSYDSFRLAKEEIASLRADLAVAEEGGPQEDQTPLRPQELMGDLTYWIFESKRPEGVFGSVEAIEVMRSAEIMFTRHKQYPAYCFLAYDDDSNNTSCNKPFSALSSYYSSFWNSTVAQRVIEQLTPENVELYNSIALCVEYGVMCQFLPPSVSAEDLAWARQLNSDISSVVANWDGEGELNADKIDEVTSFNAHIKELVTKSPLVSFFFDKDFGVNNTVSMYSRSIVFWGSPLKKADDASEDELVTSRSGRRSSESDTDLRKEHIVKVHLDGMKEISAPDNNDYINSYYFMGSLIFDVIIDILVSDALRAILSFFLVFAYLRLMLGSWFLTCVGMLEIAMSLPIAWFFYSAVFQIKYFSSLNVLCLFIVAAIGADDIFVFMDAYKQSATRGKKVLESLESRMSWVYRRSGSAMAITSATTCAAFLCTIASPIASTKSFGIFAALVILFDYVLVMTLFCTSVVIFHNRFEQPGFCCFQGFCALIEPSPTEMALAKAESEKGPVEDKISKFFRTRVAGFVLKGRNRRALLIPFVGWLATASYYTSQLEPTRTSEQALADDHPLQKSATILREHFPQTEQDTATKIQFAWGIGDVNRDGVNQLLDPYYTGAPTFVDSFNFGPECQEVMLETCNALKTDEQFETLIKRKDGGFRAVNCFVEEFGAYNALGNLGDCDAVKSGSSWQGVELDNVNSAIESFVDQGSCYGDESIMSYYSDGIGWDGSSLRYAGISVESRVIDPWGTLPEELVREQYDAWMEITREFDAKMEGQCGAKVLMTDSDQKFIFMNNQRIYRTSAVSGSVLGGIIAFVVLLISTRRFHVAFFATLSILSVLVSVIGTVTWMGWTLGTNEAILISILAGFSVDYVVHLAHAYVTSHGDTATRIRDAFADMGISVFSGMMTSVVASIPLFLCTLTFFAKFGTFLVGTIAFSWLFANFAFMSVLAQANIPMKKSKAWSL